MNTPVKTPPPRPVPTLDDDNRPFWEAVAAGALHLQQCDACGHVRYPISHVCPDCLAGAFHWQPMSGRGTVFSSIVFHQVYNPAFAGEVPYNVSIVQLDEGPRMFSNVVGQPPSSVAVGDRVRLVCNRVADGLVLPQFERDDAGSASDAGRAA